MWLVRVRAALRWAALRRGFGSAPWVRATDDGRARCSGPPAVVLSGGRWRRAPKAWGRRVGSVASARGEDPGAFLVFTRKEGRGEREGWRPAASSLT